MVSMVREKSGNSTFQSRRKLRGSGKVIEFKSTRVQRLTKMQKKFLNCCMQTAYNRSKFFLLALFADYLYMHF